MIEIKAKPTDIPHMNVVVQIVPQSELCSFNRLFIAFFDSIWLNVWEKYCIIKLQIMITRESSNVFFLDLNELKRASHGWHHTHSGWWWAHHPQQFVDNDVLYGKQNVTNEHFTVREDTWVTDELICNNKSDYEDGKLE